MSVPNESQIFHCSGPVLLNSVTRTPNDAEQLSWAVDQLRSDGRVKAIVCHCVAEVYPRRCVETRCRAGQGNGLDPQLLDFFHVPNEDGPLLLPRIFQNTLFQLVDHRTPPPHLALQWTRDDRQITQRSGSPRAAGASRGGGRRSAGPAYPAISETPARWSRTRLVEEDSQGQRPTYSATGHHHSDPHIQPIFLTTPHRLPLAAKTVVCCVPSRLFLPLNETLSRFNGSEMEVEFHDVWDRHHPAQQAAPRCPYPAHQHPSWQHHRHPNDQHLIQYCSTLLGTWKEEGQEGVGMRAGDQTNPYTLLLEKPQLLHLELPLSTEVDRREPVQPRKMVQDDTRHIPPHSLMLPAILTINLLFWALPHAVQKPLWAQWDRVMRELSPGWLRTTLLCGHLVVNKLGVYHVQRISAKLLETGTSLSLHPLLQKGSLRDVVIFTIGGCPGLLWNVAPTLGGILLSRNLPVYINVVLFLFAGICVVMLKEELRGTSGPGGVEKEESRLCSDVQRS
ncbi:hypothetical protein BKA70DRAFT_1413709 [Coprinopsis sp. MPI-PUGE-AT-0042]|nr:hypothetical protein BKA70DRAFT_1413709 [Coprinopsis sp. MPI-PUGE-AT-0042]